MIVLDGDDVSTSTFFDVCIVGAGAAGLALAQKLARHGRRVAVIECGDERRWNRKSQALNRTKLSGVYHWGAHTGRYRALGGSTTRWSGQVIELDTEDFDERPWLNTTGWPFKKAAISRFYDEARLLLRLPPPLNKDELKNIFDCETLFDGAKEIEYRTSQIAPELKFYRLFGEDIHAQEGAQFFTQRCVTEVLLSAASNQARGVRCVSYSGSAIEVRSTVTVLAMGGIENTRFLLNQEKLPIKGVDHLGKFFTDHLQIEMADVDVTRPEAAGALGPKLVILDGIEMVPKIKLSSATQKRLGLLNAAAMIDYPADRKKLVRIASQILLGPWQSLTAENAAFFTSHAHQLIFDGLATRHKSLDFLRSKRRVLSMNVEQDPLSPSSISLSDKHDRFGLRLAHLDWKVTEREVETISTFFQVLKRRFERSGIITFKTQDDITAEFVRTRAVDSYHHMGGTRMSFSASSGVVDADLQVHGVEGLYVCGSSVFPSGGFANPTHTIIALALRLAEHLDSKLRKNR